MCYSFLFIHDCTASWTARDRSPFLPPNFSTVFILSCFSSSSEMSTFIRPNFSHCCCFFLISESPESVFVFLSALITTTYYVHWCL